MAEPSRSNPSAAEPAHAGEQLQRLRLAAGMTVAEVAQRAGVDAEWLAGLEAGEGTHDVLYYGSLPYAWDFRYYGGR